MGRRVLNKQPRVAWFLVLALLLSSVIVTSTNPSVDDASAANTTTCAAGVLTPLHDSNFYWDRKTGSGAFEYSGAYLGYRVQPQSNLTAPSVKVTIPNGQPSVTLATGQAVSETLPALNAGSTASAYFLVNVRTSNATDEIKAELFDGSTKICELTQDITSQNRRALAANANKIYSATISAIVSGTVRGLAGQTITQGSRFRLTVVGNTGTIGAGPDGKRAINLTPVVIPSSFNPAAWRLVDVIYKANNNNCGTSGYVYGRLHFSTATTPTSLNCGGLYSASYLFEARTGSYNTFDKVQAFAYIASGTQIKHTSPYGSMPDMPKVGSGVGTLSTTDPGADLDAVIQQALTSGAVGLTANDLFANTQAGTPVTFSAFSYLGSSASLDWNNVCLINPTNAAECGNGPYTVNETQETDTGTVTITSAVGNYRLVTVGSQKRILYTPANSNFSTANTDTKIEFKITDTSNPAQTSNAFAFVTVTSSLIASPVSMTTGQNQTTESSPIPVANGTPASTCFITSNGCVTSVTIPGEGTWSISGTASAPRVSFTPANGFTGNASIDFQVTGTNSQTSQSTAFVEVFGAPSIGSVSITTPQGTPASQSAAVSGGQAPYSYCISETIPITLPCSTTQISTSNAVWSIQNGRVSVSPSPSFTGTATVYIAVIDGRSQLATNSATLTVTPPSPPTIQNASATTNTGIRVTLSPTITASTSYTLYLISNSASVSSTTTAAGSWIISGAQVSFMSYNNFTGSATINVQVVDGIGQGATATMTVTVTAPAGPTVTPRSSSTTTTSPVTLTPIGSSTLPLTYCLEHQSNRGQCGLAPIAQSGVGSWAQNVNQITFTAVVGFTGSATISIIVTDTLGQTGSATLTVTVNDAMFGAQAVMDALTHAASSITNTTATLNGSGYAPGSAAATFWFCYDTTVNVATCNAVAATPTSATAGNSASISLAVTGLTAGTTYYFKAMAFSGGNTASGTILNFTTTGVAPTTPAPTPTPTATTDPGPAIPAEPKICKPKVETSSVELGLVGVITRLFISAATFASQTFAFLLEPVMNSSVGSALLAAQPALANPLLGSNTMVEVGQTTVAQMFRAAAPKTSPTLDPSTITLSPGSTSGEIVLQSSTGDDLQLLDAQFTDYRATTEFSGSDFNNPLTWQKLGYGAMCWKLEPFGDTDYFYMLPFPLQLPAGAAAGEWEYSNVIVKAGSLVARSEEYQTDTVFAKPLPGARVFADVNANGIFDPGGRTGDKAISHIVICAKLKSISTPTTQATASPTASPTPTATPTTTPTPTTTATPTPTGTATPTPTASVTPSASPTATQTPTPTATATPTPSVTPTVKPEPLKGDDCIWPEPTTQPKIAEPTPVPTTTNPPIIIRLQPLTPTPTPSPTGTTTPTPSPTGTATPTPSPTGTATPTPSPTGTATPTPSPTGTATPTPSPTGTATPTPSPTGTATPTPSPTGTGTPVPPVSPDSSLPCTPNETYGAALLISNGGATTCYRTTSLALFNVAFAPFIKTSEPEFEETESPVALPTELADTGFDNGLLALLAMLMAGFGFLAIRLSRKRD